MFLADLRKSRTSADNEERRENSDSPLAGEYQFADFALLP